MFFLATTTTWLKSVDINMDDIITTPQKATAKDDRQQTTVKKDDDNDDEDDDADHGIDSGNQEVRSPPPPVLCAAAVRILVGKSRGRFRSVVVPAEELGQDEQTFTHRHDNDNNDESFRKHKRQRQQGKHLEGDTRQEWVHYRWVQPVSAKALQRPYDGG